MTWQWKNERDWIELWSLLWTPEELRWLYLIGLEEVASDFVLLMSYTDLYFTRDNCLPLLFHYCLDARWCYDDFNKWYAPNLGQVDIINICHFFVIYYVSSPSKILLFFTNLNWPVSSCIYIFGLMLIYVNNDGTPISLYLPAEIMLIYHVRFGCVLM